jgi:ubiquinol-cytochrome c reductase subunit 7
VQEALARLPKDQLYGRYQRYKIALHQSMLRRELPESQWMTRDRDVKYLQPFVEQVLSEYEERDQYEKGLFDRSP